MRPIGTWRSGRVTTSVKLVVSPPLALETDVAIDGPNGRWQGAPMPSHEVWNEADGVSAGPPDHGVTTAVAVCVPHVVGVTSAERGPPLNVSVKSVNAICGRSSKSVVIWPVS